MVIGRFSAYAGIEVESSDIQNSQYIFKVAGEDLLNVGGALEKSENIDYCRETFPFDDPASSDHISFLYFKGESQKASIILKWDFKKSGRRITKVTIPNNRLYFDLPTGNEITRASAVISYSVDGRTWVPTLSFNPTIAPSNAETTKDYIDEPIDASFSLPAAEFYYRVEFIVEGVPPNWPFFQWERMGSAPDWLQPDYFEVDFTLTPGNKN